LKVSFKLVEIFRYIEEMDERGKNKITGIKKTLLMLNNASFEKCTRVRKDGWLYY
jgi:hypothetical protein